MLGNNWTLWAFLGLVWSIAIISALWVGAFFLSTISEAASSLGGFL